MTGAGKEKQVEVRVNGEEFAIEGGAGQTIGEVLAQADARLEAAGAVIVALSIDGKAVDPEVLEELSGRPLDSIASIDIAAESSSEYRAKAIDLLLDLVGAASPLPDEEARGKLGSALATLTDSLGGLFPADELSFIKGLREVVDDRSSEDGKILSERLTMIAALFRERLAELRDPVAEFRRASSVYRGAAEELRELPVWMQTGKEGRAMQAVLVFVELFDKIIRLMPELGKHGVDANAIKVDGLELPAFYSSFNGILRDLAKAIEDRDSVLIGDLSEYEVAPRMEGLFAAIGEALPA